jgi:hypothetical protein
MLMAHKEFFLSNMCSPFLFSEFSIKEEEEVWKRGTKTVAARRCPAAARSSPGPGLPPRCHAVVRPAPARCTQPGAGQLLTAAGVGVLRCATRE